MIEQGFAQQRMWARGDAGVEVGCDSSILGQLVETGARDFVERMQE
jgi:quinate dehydrogenase